MVKALFALATDDLLLKPLVSRCCVANLTHMLQTSSSNQMHVLVASNNISLSCLEGRICLITLLNPLPVLIILLNPLPVLVALKILRDILSFTHSFMINTRSLVGCLENSDRKVIKTIPCYTTDCFKLSCFQLVATLQRDSRFVSKLSRNRHCTNRTAWLEWLLNHLQ